MTTSNYKAQIDDSIFADLSPFIDNLMISDHEKLDSEKKGCLYPILGTIDKVVSELYSVKDDCPIDDYLSAIDDYLRCNEHLDELNLEHLNNIDLEHEPKDTYPSYGYIEDSESSTNSLKYVDDSQEYIEETC
ncbi:hypothetical protein R3W88_014854 [Solanum pinnatisectum]|uniref:Uncharacterized protein n=1 Tax=Solanum pinnatisectum TaxID=50273 RepID=A0AAV9KSS9_9SOLN|nr:hypothetical protein R3W88_014854 [Solanum pinnatisectum]